MIASNKIPVSRLLLAVVTFLLLFPALQVMFTFLNVLATSGLFRAVAITVCVTVFLYLWLRDLAWLAISLMLLVWFFVGVLWWRGIWSIPGGNWSIFAYWVAVAGFLGAFVVYVILRRRVWLVLSASLFLLVLTWTLSFDAVLSGGRTGGFLQFKLLTLDADPVEVYCNGEPLGQTPLLINITELFQTIPPMAQPKSEPAYQTKQVFPTGEAFPDNKHWWTFSKQGHAGIIPASEEVKKMEFPSARAQADALVHALQHMDYAPDAAWIAHVRKHLHTLFRELSEAATNDQRVLPALQQAVKEEFGIKDEMSAVEVEACWNLILDRVGELRFFKLDTPEWCAINLMGDRLTPLLKQSFHRESTRRKTRGKSTKRDGACEGSVSMYVYPPRFSAVYYAVGILQPEELRDEILYRSGVYGQPYTLLAERDAIYDGRIRQSSFARHYFDGDLRDVAEVLLGDDAKYSHVPDLVPIIQAVNTLHAYDVFRQSAAGQEFDENFHGRRTCCPFPALHGPGLFMTAALMPTPVSAEGLLTEINRPLQPAQQGPNDPFSRKLRAQGVWFESPYSFQNMLDSVAVRPNPHMEKVLLTLLERSQTDPGLAEIVEGHLFRALVTCDTPATREAIQGMWQANGTFKFAHKKEGVLARGLIMKALATLPRNAPALKAWTPALAALEDPAQRVQATPALAKIDSPEAWDVLAAWASDPNADVAAAAKAQLDAEQKELAYAKELLADTNAPESDAA